MANLRRFLFYAMAVCLSTQASAQLNVGAPAGAPNGARTMPASVAAPALAPADSGTPATINGDGVPDLVVGTDVGGGLVNVLSGVDGAALVGGPPFGPGFTGGVRVAAADFTGDGIADVVTGSGPGAAEVRIFDGATATMLASFSPFGASTGGVYVAAGDINGDGQPDLVVGGGEGVAQAISFDGSTHVALASGYPFGTGYVGGVTVALGDVNGDGRLDYITGMAAGGLVRVFDGLTLAPLAAGFPYGLTYTGGVYVAAGDITGDGHAEVVTAQRSAPSAAVSVFDVASQSLLASFVPHPDASGVTVAVGDVNGDGFGDLLTGAGPGGAPQVRLFSGATHTELLNVLAFPAGFHGGVFVTTTASQGLRFTSADATAFTTGVADTFTITTAGGINPPIVITSGTLPTGVTFTDNGDGTATLAGPPAAGTAGTYPLTFQAGTTVTETQNFTLTVQEAPVANHDTYTVAEGGTLTPAAPGVLSNDTDVDTPGPLSAILVTGPTQATSFTLNADGSFSYTHNGSETLTDFFTYRASDGAVVSNVATVTITITLVDDPPTAVDDAYAVAELGTLTPPAPGVLGNDQDPEGQLLSAILVTGPTHASVFTFNPNGSFTYTNNGDDAPIDTFTYRAQAGGADSNTATVTITIINVNDPPLVVPDTFDVLGNTELRVDMTAGTTPHTSETTTGPSAVEGVLDNDGDPEGDPIAVTGISDCTVPDTTPPFDCTLTDGAVVHVEANGEFSYTPAPGATSGSFTYTVTDTPAQGIASSVNGTVTFNFLQPVWYVDADFAGTSNGTSIAPFINFTSISGAGGSGDSDSPGDYIFVHAASATVTTTLELEANQHLLGEGVGLSIPVDLNGNGSPTNLVPAGANPIVTSAADTIRATHAMPAEIRGLTIGSTASNAIDLTTATLLSGAGTLTIANNVINGAGAEGIDINLDAGTTGTLALTIASNTWNLAGTHSGNAVEIDRLGGTLNLNFTNNTNIKSNGTAVLINGGAVANTVITGFANNSVHQSTLSGVSISNVTFDADTAAGGFQQVNGGTLAIGVSGDPVGTFGIQLLTVQGNLFFDDLDVFAGTSGVTATGTGSGLTLAVTPASPDGSGTSSISAPNGAAVDVTSAAIDLRLSSLASTTSTSAVALSTVSGQFRAPSGSTISKTSGAGTAFSVGGSSATVNYGGTMNVTSGAGVGLANNTGAVNFTGQLTLNTGASAAFSATGASGTVTATNATNTLTTTTGTALNVNGPDIGVGGLVFRSIASNGAASGIILQDTGTTAGLTVSGTGSAGSGGTIQNTTGHGISLTSTRDVSLNWMSIQNSANNGINGTAVTNFTFTNSTMTGAGDVTNEHGIFITDLFGTSAITGSSITDSFTKNLFVSNNNATAGTLTINNSTFSNTTDSDAVTIETNVSGNFTVNLTGSNNLNDTAGDGLQASANQNSTLHVTVDGSGSNYNGNLGSAVNIAASGSASITALVSGFTGVSTGTNGVNGLNAINIQNFDTSTINATVQNNTITGLGNNASGIRIIQEANGTITANINNNTISGFVANGIVAQARAGTGNLNLTIGASNNINLASALALDGVSIESGSSAGSDTNTVCLNMFNNTSVTAAQQGYRLRQRTGTTFRLQNFVGNGASTADVTTWVNTTKGNIGTTDIVIGTAFTAAPSNCPTPP